MRLAVLVSAMLGTSVYAASSAWVEDWAANKQLIAQSVQGVADLEASASAFTAEIDAAIADGTSDSELTRLLMDFLVQLDDDPRFGGFVSTNVSSTSGSVSAGSAPAAASTTGSSSSGASAVNAASLVAVAAAVVATVAVTLA